jgi:hypothetical protein
MPGLVLENEEGEYLGALLIAGSEPLEQGGSPRDAILSGVPLLPQLLAHPLGAFIQVHKHREFSCEIRKEPGGLSISASSVGPASLELSMPASGAGTFRFVLPHERELRGRCRILPERT